MSETRLSFSGACPFSLPAAPVVAAVVLVVVEEVEVAGMSAQVLSVGLIRPCRGASSRVMVGVTLVCRIRILVGLYMMYNTCRYAY